MKNNILFFLLGIFLTISVAATTDTLTIFKPAKPIATIVFVERDEDKVVSLIKQYSTQGYIVKEITAITSDSSMWYQILVVMEKY